MKTTERIKMIKAMEFLVRNVNDEEVFESWLWNGVADGDIKYGDLDAENTGIEDFEYYIEDENFSEIMALFLRVMSDARRSGGLYCDDVVSA